MAKIEQSILGYYSGKVGDVVFYRRNGQMCVRRLTESRASIGEKQREQQERMASVAILYKAAGAAGLKGYWQTARRPVGWSGYNLFVRRNLPAFTGQGLIGDFGKVCLTAGELQLPDNIRVSAAGEEWVVAWDYRSLYPATREDDRLCVALMRDEACFNVRLPACGEARRSEGKAVFRVPEEWKAYTHLFCYMRSATGGKASPSKYLGTLIQSAGV